jgi:hypothetical protein
MQKEIIRIYSPHEYHRIPLEADDTAPIKIYIPSSLSASRQSAQMP